MIEYKLNDYFAICHWDESELLFSNWESVS